MKNELFKVFKEIDTEKLSIDDATELLRIFKVVQSPVLRDRIALLFADLKYNEAVPAIIRRIKHSQNNNGTLLHALIELDASKYFIYIIELICEQDYEARLLCYDLIEKYSDSISSKIRNKALKILKEHKEIEDVQTNNIEYTDSKLHFIDSTISILSK